MNSPIIVALDYRSEAEVMALVEQLSPHSCRLKIGKELFTYCGPQLVTRLQNMGFEIFLDLKFHDIPNTVAGAVRAAADLGVWMVNVHAGGGRRMMEAAAQVLSNQSQAPLLIGVTVLTSLSADDLSELGYSESPTQRVQRLAALTADCGLDGVVCSAMEASALRQQQGEQFALVTPGIRPASAQADDQRRVVTPHQALANGATYLVVGRPITAASNPVSALADIEQSLSAA